jgi:1,4-alpha-glucan branching enzyme
MLSKKKQPLPEYFEVPVDVILAFAHKDLPVDFEGLFFRRYDKKDEPLEFKEWNYEEGVEFFLKQYPLHQKLSTYFKSLNVFYKNTPALFEIEDSWDGFEWLAADDADRNFLAYARRDRGGETYVVLLNFSGEDYKNYRLGLPKGKYRRVLDSDGTRFGGEGKIRKYMYKTKKAFSHGKEYCIEFDLPKLTCVFLEKISD